MKEKICLKAEEIQSLNINELESVMTPSETSFIIGVTKGNTV